MKLYEAAERTIEDQRRMTAGASAPDISASLMYGVNDKRRIFYNRANYLCISL